MTPARVGLRVRAGLPLSASAAGASPGPTRTSGLLRLSLRRAGLNTSNLLSPLSLRLSVIPTLPGTALVIPTQPEAELQAERGQARAVRVGPGRAPGRNRTTSTEAWLLVFRALVLTADFILHSVGCVDMVPGLQRPGPTVTY